MNIKRAKQEIKDMVAAYLLKDEYGAYVIPPVGQRPALLIGPPGIGKTQIMEQVARECGIALRSYTITHHTRQSAIGLPYVTEKEFAGQTRTVTEYTMSEIVASIYDKMEQTGLTEGILFIDEINCVSETLAPAMLQLLQGKTFGNHAIPEGWILVAAGNPPEYNKSVRELDVVTMDRVRKIEVEPDFEAWKEYAQQVSIHPAILSYLEVRPAHFYKMENTVDGRVFATPRGWEDLSRVLKVYERLGIDVDKEFVREYIQHDDIAGEFAAYLKLYRQYENDYGIPEILNGTFSQLTLKRFAAAPFEERLSVVQLLLSGVLERMKTVREQELFVQELYDRLKEAKEALLKPSLTGAAIPAVIGQLTDDARSLRERKKKAEQLEREEERRLLRLIDTLASYENQLKSHGCASGEEAFSLLTELFSRESACYESLYAQCGQALEHSFDFLQVSCGDSQEMVIYLTGLNRSREALSFLQTYSCERYDDYNKRLLFAMSDEKLRREIAALT